MLSNLYKKNKSLLLLLLILLLLYFSPSLPTSELLSLKLSNSFIDFLQQFWRIFTGHLVHASWQHLALNIINLILLRLVFTQWTSDKRFIVFLLFSATFISIGLWLTSSLSYYLGFSGIFYALAIYLLLIYWHQSKLLFSAAIILIISKIAYEKLLGSSTALSEFIQINIAIDAHILGALAGSIFWVLEKKLNRQKIRH
ncbi:MAG: rhombosortase [Cellvibrionaceae bacterium]